MKTTAEKIEVMQSFRYNKFVQEKARGRCVWVDNYFEPKWDWDRYDYRIKPEEKEPPTLESRIQEQFPDENVVLVEEIAI